MEPTASTPRSQPWRPSRRRALQAAIVLLALALLWSAAALYAPPLLRHEIERIGSARLGRAVTVGAVSFNPWTLEATLADLRIAGAAAGDAPQLQVRRLHVDAALQSLFRLAPVIDAIEVDTPAVRLTRVADGRYDIDDVLDRLASGGSKSTEPARFAVHNIVVSHGSADFSDVPVKATHRLRDVDLAVPFISSLPAQRKIRVEPRLAFTLDGSRFDSAAAATPFDASLPGTATLSLKGFDVAPWLGYAPRGLPLQLRSALLEADLRLAFEQQPRLSLRISGRVGASHIQVADAAARDLLDVGSIAVAIDELRPLEQVAKLRRIDIAAPHLLAARDAAGRINLLLAGEAPGGAPQAVARVPLPKSAASAAAGASTASAAAAAASAPAASPWKVSLAELALRAGRIEWHDAAIAPAVAIGLDDFTLDAQALQWPLDAPVVFKGEGSLGAGSNRGKVAFSGSGNATQATVRVAVDALPLALAGPYLHGVLVPALDGTLSADVGVAWRAAAGAAPQLSIDARRIAVDALRLGDARSAEAAADRVELLDAHLDTTARSAVVGRLALVAPRLKLERAADGGWSFDRWRAAVASAPPPTGANASRATATTPARSASAAGDGRAWQLALGDLALERGRVNFADRSQGTPVALDVSEIAVRLHGFALDGAKPTPFHLAALVAVPAAASGASAGSGFAGSVDARGELAGWAGGVPASARAALLLKDLPLHLLAPYVADRLNLVVQKAQTSLRGDVAYERLPGGPRLRLSGDATVDDFRAGSTAADAGAPQRALQMLPDGSGGRQLLNWKSLSLRGFAVEVTPGRATQVSVALTSLSDFFARIVLSETGRLNLQDLVKTAPETSAAAAPPVLAAASTATATATASAGPAAIIRSGPIALVNGRVNYTDLFVKPNYSANLSELNGSLSSFSSVSAAPGEAPELAGLTLRGRVEGSATLEIDGKVNPLAKPLALDLQAKVRDLELPPLSTYSVKYAGYGIERGKMSVDLAYLVKPDGQLTASNKIVLNQLAFGDKVEGAPASLPVKLAVALLADRHGVIDVDLPIGGSINDPQFSLGGLIWKAITTLVVKAVTAPFSLLASAFGGGGASADQLATIEFMPGTATLTPAAKASLDKIAGALADRPQLTMTVSGESRLDVEQGAWKQDRLQQIVRAEKRRTALGGAANSDPTVSAAEYPELLKSVYKRADVAKPKNAIGFAKDLPTNEMEALLLASIVVPDDAMQQLAVRRGVAVREYLEAHSLPASRLFLGAPKVAPAGADWTPRADLKLATQ